MAERILRHRNSRQAWRWQRKLIRYREIQKQIKANAPEDTGKYAKSWTAKKVRETSQTLTMVVHSKNRYQLAHLLEYGHAKRNGGRVEGKAHIAPAEQHGIRQLQEEIERALRG